MFKDSVRTAQKNLSPLV